ncbi:MAG: ubiquitin-conjugating enzyme E2 [Methylocystaceae bacterium]
MTPRERRLAADYEQIQNYFTGHPNIIVEPVEGRPPDRYLVTYHLQGLRWDNRLQRPVENNFHQAEIYLHREYPRLKPRCLMKTEIFHPNFGDWICVGDYWAASETLADIIIQIGQMIQYQVYNTRSPVNTTAAHWARENGALLPIGNIDLYRPDKGNSWCLPLADNNGTAPISIDLSENEAKISVTNEDDLDIDLL